MGFPRRTCEAISVVNAAELLGGTLGYEAKPYGRGTQASAVRVREIHMLSDNVGISNYRRYSPRARHFFHPWILNLKIY